MQLNYAIVIVSDMRRSVAFYSQVLGLPIRFESTHWTEFESGAATLALHLHDPASGSGEVPPLRAGQSRPGLTTPDLDAFHERMKQHGVPCAQEPRDTFGTRIAQYKDPDGLVLSVSEHAKE